MKKKWKEFLDKLLNHGTRSTDDMNKIRRVRLLNACIWLGICSLLIFSVYNLLINKFAATVAAVIQLSGAVLTYIIYRVFKYRFITSFVLVLILMEALVLITSLYLLPGKNAELFFLFMAITPHIFFQNFRWAIFCFFINLIFYFLPQLLLHPYPKGNFVYITPTCVFTIMFLLIRFFRIQVVNYEEALQQKNEALAHDKTLIDEQANRLKELDKQKTEFFTNVSHEFRTPLTLITGIAENLLKPNSSSDNEKTAPHLQKIKLYAEKMTAMVDEIMNLAKAGSSDYKLLKSPVRLSAFFEKISDIFSFTATNKNITIIYEVLPVELSLLIDENKFDIIFSNLISNAIKFSLQDGVIKITATETADGIVITVTDYGIGIEESRIPEIFTKYTTTQNEYNPKGTGIGLSLTKQLVELHDGAITAHSTLGKGTTISIVLPMQCRITDSAFTYDNYKNTTPYKKSAVAYNILYAEDNPDMRYYVSEILMTSGYNLNTARGGVEAFELIKSGTYDLLITDYMMPDMDGLELLRRIKESGSCKNVPVIFLSARNSDRAKLNVLELGVDDYITKPFNNKELLARVRNLLSRSELRKKYIIESNIETGLPEDKQFIKDFQAEVEKQILNSDLKIPDIAYHLNTTERNLYRKIKAITGLTPNELVREVKLQHALKLLEANTFSTVKQVAAAVGYDTASYFVKQFENRFGKHPSEFWEN